MLWKPLQELVHEKKMMLENDLKAEIQQLERRLALVRQEYEKERVSRGEYCNLDKMFTFCCECSYFIRSFYKENPVF